MNRQSRIAPSQLAAWFVAAAMLLLVTPGLAHAQDVPQVISPLMVEQDPNGVNLATGRTEIDVPTISVPAAPRLTFDRIQNAAPYINGRLEQGGPDQQRVESHSAHLGAAGSESFNCVDYDCLSVTGTGSKLKLSAVNRILTQSQSGTKYYFTVKHVLTTGTPGVSLFYASHVDYTDGEVISYTYNAASFNGLPYYRPTRVSSNVGYHIDITYQGNDFDNDPTSWQAVAQATLYKDSAPTVPLAQLSYSWVGGDPSANTITDLGGRTYQCAGCGNLLGVNIESWQGSFKLPGEATPAKQVTRTASYDLIGSVNRDGKQWIYNYTNVQLTPQTGGYSFDTVAVTGPDAQTTTYTMGHIFPPTTTRNAVVGITDPLGRTISYQIDEFYRPISATMPEGDNVQIGYDDQGNIFNKTYVAKSGSGLANRVETLHFDDPLTCLGVMCWRPSWYKDAKGYQTDYSYNGQGQLTEKLEPADANGVRRKTIIEYDSGIRRKLVVRVCGDTTTCGTPQEIRTEYSYFGSTFLPTSVRQIDQAGAVTSETTYAYDDAGRLLITDGPIAGTTDASYNRYDIYGRKTWEIGPAGTDGVRQATRYSYRDSDDKVVATDTGYVTDPSAAALTATHSHLDTSYDARRNPIRQKMSSGSTTLQINDASFDALNRPLCSAERMNPAVFATVTSDACVLGTSGTQGPDRITKNVYDAAGQLLKIQRAVGTAIEQDYATYSYTANGKQGSVTDANGNRTGYTYDGFDRLLRWNFPSKTAAGTTSTTDYEQYGYDANGNRTSLRKRDGSTLTWQYDALNRNIVKVVPSRSGLTAAQVRDVYTGYDFRNQPLYVRFDSGASSSEGLTYAYDGLGRQTSAALTMDGVTRTLSYGYDLAGRRTSVTHPDGQIFTYAYDGAARATSVTQGANVLAGFSYNNRGLPATLTSGVSTSYGYDNLGRLSTLTHDLASTANDVGYTLGYNAASQLSSRTLSNDLYGWNGTAIVSRTYSVNGLNQYTAAGPASFTYDANGNLTGDGTKTYLYDIENRLVSTSGAVAASLRYDPLGRLYETVGGGVTTRFLYDGDELVGEYNTAGTLLRRYVHGASVDDPIVWYESASVATTALRRMRANWQGSIVAITDNAGAKIAINGYDEWGIPNVDTNGNAINTGRFQYTGQAWLPEIGLYYYKARLYSPTLGRFMQTDPVGYEDGLNWYAYVGNDPINGLDSKGTKVEPCDGNCTKSTTRPWSEGNRKEVQRSKERRESKGKAASQAGQAVSGAAAARGVITDAAERSPGGGAGPVKAGGAILGGVAAGLDVKEQIDGGKPADQAIANSAGRAGFGAGVATAGTALAPETLGGSLVVAGVVLVADKVLGGKVGDVSERAYVGYKNAVQRQSDYNPNYVPMYYP